MPNQELAGKSLKIEASLQPIAIDATRTAVIVVDMQNDFGSKGGMFERAGIDISMIQKAVAPTGRVLDAARQMGIKIVYLKMALHPDLSNLGPPDAPNRSLHMRLNVGEKVTAPDGTESRILVRDTWNTDIVAELEPKTEDIIVYKHRFSGFFQTELDSILKGLDAKYLIITGCTTSICVESTVRDAMFRDYLCVLLEDCMAEPMGNHFSRSSHEASLYIMQSFAWISDSKKFLCAVEEAQGSTQAPYLSR